MGADQVHPHMFPPAKMGPDEYRVAMTTHPLHTPVNREFTLDALSRYVEIDSVNPAFSASGRDESGLAAVVADDLRTLGLDVHIVAAQPGRDSVLGVLRGSGEGPSLMLYAHLDTVGVQGMKAPFTAVERDNKLYGRGAYDMKAGLAACVGAAAALSESGHPPAGDVWVAAVADEENASLGIRAVLEQFTPDAAIVTEPTDHRLCVAHKGFAWFEIITEGRAAHGSRYKEGMDANLRMGRVLAELERLERELRTTSIPHHMVGPPSLHAAVLAGGSGISTYAAECRLQVERRTIPGETEASTRGELEDILARLSLANDFHARLSTLMWRDAFEASPDSAIVPVVRNCATRLLGERPVTAGETYWMDAAFLQAAGTDTVVFGPVGGGAHAAVEWVDLDSVVSVAEVLAHSARSYCGRR